MTADYSIKVTVRNARILRRMKELGIKTVTELSRRSGVCQSTLGLLINMRKPPLKNLSGLWTEPALALSAALRTDPEELWTESQRTMKLSTNTQEISISEDELRQLMSSDRPERLLGQRQGLMRALDTIKPRDRECIERYYLHDEAMEDIAQDLGVGRSRVSNIIRRGLRQLQHPDRRKYISDYRYPDEEG